MNLVTGATGIIGSHVLLALLQKNQPVIACKQKNSDLSKVRQLFAFYTANHEELVDRINWIDLDICDLFSVEDALQGIDTVYHCAGFVSFNRNQRKRLMDVNHIGTRILVDACLAKGIKALCHISSMATVNNLDYTQTLNEDVFWKLSGKESDYAVSKYNGEREVWRGIEEGLNAVIVNPGVVLSPGFWEQSSSRLFNTCYKGSLFYTEGSSAYVAATDVAACMIQLTEGRYFNNRYLLIENNYSIRRILDLIHTHFHKAVPKINASKNILYMGWIADSIWSFMLGRKSVLTRSLINSALNNQQYSNKKVKDALNFQFKPVDKVIEEICANYLLLRGKDGAMR